MAGFEFGEALAGVDNCAREPVHIIGQIQSHGLLFALSEPDLVVRQVSANVHALLGVTADSLIGGRLETVLGEKQFAALRSQIQTDDLLAAKPLRMIVGNWGHEVNCIAHRQDRVLIVEIELLERAHSLEPVNVAAHVQIPFARLERASDIDELARVAAIEIRSLSGFGRVMVYQFDQAWNGEVIAEIADPSPVSYLGLRFPASDIPAQARQLFLNNPLRAIADVASAPVPIVPEINPLTGRALNLTRSFLRSASPIHIQYLRNMGVGSSMTVSIIVQNRLWGMIACHDSEPRIIDCATRSVCEVVGALLASQLAFRSDNVALQQRLAARRALENYMAGTEASTSLFGARPLQSARLLELFDADGLISRIDDVVAFQGVTVAESALLAIIGKLRTLSSRGIASSNELQALDEGARAFANEACGALYLGLSEGTGDYVLFLRREHVQTVRWAGNPDKSLNAQPDGTLRPRTSFAAWQQIVRGRSRPWTDIEVESARFLREQLLRMPETQRFQKLEERVRYLESYDEMTGLINRPTVHVKLEQCRRDAAAERSSFAVLVIDLDGFRECNARLGQSAGDHALKTIAARLQQQCRGEDVVGRLGGDEFVILLPRLLGGDAVRALERILGVIAQPIAVAQAEEVRLTASAGLAWSLNDDTSSAALNRSYAAMLRAKQKGGGAIECASMDEASAARSAAGNGWSAPAD